MIVQSSKCIPGYGLWDKVFFVGTRGSAEKFSVSKHPYVIFPSLSSVYFFRESPSDDKAREMWRFLCILSAYVSKISLETIKILLEGCNSDSERIPSL
jgi:hypothetical protein